MENKIKFKFLNYRKYSTFLSDLIEGKISYDSIVFIQENLRIWARGKEYICKPYDDTDIRSELRDTVKKSELKDPDEFLSNSSTNAVLNKVIYSKIYEILNDLLPHKQNNLTAGNGIDIQDDVISVTLDTDVFVFVEDLPSNPSDNKIYIREEVIDGETKFIAYKYKDGSWVSLGEKTPSLDLSGYTKTTDVLNMLRPYAKHTDVDQKIEQLRADVASIYVPKRDVYTPDIYSSGEDPGEGGPDNGNTQPTPGYTPNNMITLTQSAYDALVEAGEVLENVYYFTYEGEEETTNWTFGDTFPIILAGEGMGTFPINLI